VFVRASDRSPTEEFFEDIAPRVQRKFRGQFDAITKMGAPYCNHQRFKPLHEDGKPLWEFKESDHRLYCHRQVLQANALFIVLFNGWVKQRKGKTDKERREIEKAIQLYQQFLAEGGHS
jgi:hypothetical protein